MFTFASDSICVLTQKTLSMGLLVDIFTNSLLSIFLGFLFALGGVILLFLAIQGWYKNRTFTPLSYVAGAVVFCFFLYQSILICGAFACKSFGDEIEARINEIVALRASFMPDYKFSREQTDEIFKEATAVFPVIAEYVGWADFEGHTPLNIAASMHETLDKFLNIFILKRLGWCLLFLVLGALAVIKTMDVQRAIASRRRTGSSARTHSSDEF